VAANISPGLAAVSTTILRENKAVNATMAPNLFILEPRKYNMAVESTGRRQAKIVPSAPEILTLRVLWAALAAPRKCSVAVG